MKYLLFQRDGRLKIDWSDELANVGRDLVLVASSTAASKHRQADREHAEILITDDFSSAGLAEVVGRYGGADAVRVATLDEDLVLPMARLRSRLGIAGQGFAEAFGFTDKIVMKRRAARAGVAVPRYTALAPGGYDQSAATYHRLVAELGWPFFVKPTTCGGSLGTAKIASPRDWARWCSTRDPELIHEADEFITGALFHADTVLRSKQPPLVMTAEYTAPNGEGLNGRVIGSIALDPAADLARGLTTINLEVLRCLGASAGVYHLEAFRTGTGSWVFLEVAARPCGAMAPEMYLATFGVNVQNQALLSQFSGETEDIEYTCPRSPVPRSHAVWAWVLPRAGVLASINEPRCDGTVSSYWRCRPGDTMRAAEHLQQRVGGALIVTDDAASARRNFEYLRDEYRPLTMRGEPR